jgi:hypothetical protein
MNKNSVRKRPIPEALFSITEEISPGTSIFANNSIFSLFKV